jgi:hypothetical protein
MSASKITLEWQDEDGEDQEYDFPSRQEVCWRCEGHGTHLTPSIGEHAYSIEEFRESFDEEESEEYFRRGGRYDVTCHTCHGNRVIPVVDSSRLSVVEAVFYASYKIWKEDCEREEDADRRTAYYENGGY